MTEKEAYDTLARTPKWSSRKVGRLLDQGRNIVEIARVFGRPEGNVPSAPFFTPACEDYPELLRQLTDPPLRLFHRGYSKLEKNSVCVAIVGSRKATNFGKEFARRLGRMLTESGVCVCSGLAEGIDGAAHWGALEALTSNTGAAPPLGVLGHGWNHSYPWKHRELRQRMETHGGLLSEFPPEQAPSRWSFVARNRIIAALAHHVVVVEAGSKSGSLHTADFALDLGRTLHVVPHRPGQPNSDGVLKLLEEGASPLCCPERFIESVTGIPGPVSGSTTTPYHQLDSVQKSVLRCLLSNETEPNQISRTLRLPITDTAHTLARLEISGLVRRGQNGGWDLVHWDLASKLLSEVL